MNKESTYLLQKVDCNCNDCIHMVRDFDKTKAHVDSYEGTGLTDRLTFGNCSKFEKPISFIPNVCQIETQECFKHRKDDGSILYFDTETVTLKRLRPFQRSEIILPSELGQGDQYLQIKDVTRPGNKKVVEEIGLINWNLVSQVRDNRDQCFYCEQEITSCPIQHTLLRTIDHVIPRSRAKPAGGVPHINTLFSCSGCNSKKGAKLPREWIKKVQKICDNIQQNNSDKVYWTTILKNLNRLLNQENNG